MDIVLVAAYAGGWCASCNKDTGAEVHSSSCREKLPGAPRRPRSNRPSLSACSSACIRVGRRNAWKHLKREERFEFRVSSFRLRSNGGKTAVGYRLKQRQEQAALAFSTRYRLKQQQEDWHSAF